MTQEEHTLDDVWASLPRDEEKETTRGATPTTPDHLIPAVRQEEGRMNVLVYEYHKGILQVKDP